MIAGSRHFSSMLLLAGLAACSRQEQFAEQRLQMHTIVEIKVLAPARDEQAVRRTMGTAFAAMAAVEKELSWFEKENDLARIRRAVAGQVVPVSPLVLASLQLARRLNQLSGGMYDVCAGPLIRAWGFGPGKTNSVPSEHAIADTLARSGMDKLVILADRQAVSTVVAGVDVDLSSLAAGCAVDQAAAALLAGGCSNFLINGGGEIRTASTGRKTWRIGIQVPAENAAFDTFFPDRIITLKNGCVSTSGSYRNFYKAGSNTYAHIVNPMTGRPAKTDTISVTTWAESCTLADAWSTALFALPAARALTLADQLPELECLIVERPAPGSNQFRFHYSKEFR